ncbi:S9 family peptidase [Lachnospiraceae bacterium 45-P1]
MEKLKIDDLMNYKFLSGITASPAGKKAAFVVKKANEKKNSYDSWVYIVDFCTEEVRKLTSFGAEKNLLFDDEDTILFSSVRTHEDKGGSFKEKTVFYRLSLKGGEAERAFEIPYAVEEIRKLSEGTYAFSAMVDLNKPEKEEDAKDYNDYHILEELPYWANGAYFVSRFRNTLFLFDEKTASCERVTEPFFAMDGFKVCGESLVYSGSSYDRVISKTSGLYRFDTKTKETTVLQAADSMRVGLFGCEKDGVDSVKVFFAGNTMEKYGSGQYPDIYVWEKGAVTKAAVYGNSIGSVPTGDISLGGGQKFMVLGGKPYFTSCLRTKGELCVMENGQAAPLFDFDGSVDCFDAVEGGFVMVGRTPGKLQEIYFYNMETKECRQVSAVNEDALKDKYVGELHYAGFTDSDGVDIDGWVILPKDYDPKKKYPAVLDMHGGPRVAFGNTFFHEMQMFANEGYFVMLCNPRGGDGRGNEFADLREKYGTVDFKDFMEFVDHVCSLYPAVDETKIGVTGGSYGGWMTNWMIGHTDRFAAAVSQRSFSNWLSDFGCSEIGFSFDVNENGGKTPWTAPKELWERSPVAYADRVKTPTMFIHSLKDYNCPLSEGMQMFAAIKYHGVPSKAVLFEGENHELSRSGKPRHRVRRLQEMKGWFDLYLKGERSEC